MRISINKKEYVIPSSLSEITLGQRIDFQAQHGDEIQAKLIEIEKIEDEDAKELALIELRLEQVVKSISFFTGFEPEDLKSSQFIDNLVNIYAGSIAMLLEQEQEELKEQEYEFFWKDKIWKLHVPELKNGSKMTFGEFIDSKQTVQDMIQLSKGRFECLLPLCAIFLREDGEEYKESFLYEGSERLELMRELPLNIALQVGFFLTNSLGMYMKTSQFLALRG